MDNLGSWLSRKWVATVASEAVQKYIDTTASVL